MEQCLENNQRNFPAVEKGGNKRSQPQLTDIGYSSGENNSLNDGAATTMTSSSEEGMVEEDDHRHCHDHPEEDDQYHHHPECGEQKNQQQEEFVLAQNNELEKSFYRMVPLDEFGQTDLDTDEGTWPRSSYWANRFLEEVEKGAMGKNGTGGIELTDSLIVHVDGPESREKLNDFEVGVKC